MSFEKTVILAIALINLFLSSLCNEEEQASEDRE